MSVASSRNSSRNRSNSTDDSESSSPDKLDEDSVSSSSKSDSSLTSNHDIPSFPEDDISEEEVTEEVRMRRKASPTLTVSDIHTTSLTLHWKKIARPMVKVDGYRISVDNVDEGTGFQVSVPNTNSLSLSHKVIGLEPGTAYRFHVAAINSQFNVIVGQTNQVSDVIFTKLKTYISFVLRPRVRRCFA